MKTESPLCAKLRASLVMVLKQPAAFAEPLPTVAPLEDRLAAEIEKILEAGHLRPAYMNGHEKYNRYPVCWSSVFCAVQNCTT